MFYEPVPRIQLLMKKDQRYVILWMFKIEIHANFFGFLNVSC
jgi:hypothetical protein